MSEQRTTHPLLAIVGDPQVGKKALLERILHRPPLSSVESAIWTIDTRYYLADVSCLITSPQLASRPQDYEAVVLVFAVDQQQTFETCKLWASQADISQAEVRLCVANKCDKLSSPSSEAAAQHQLWAESCREWCSQEYFEYIEASQPVTLPYDDPICMFCNKWAALRKRRRKLFSFCTTGAAAALFCFCHRAHSHCCSVLQCKGKVRQGCFLLKKQGVCRSVRETWSWMSTFLTVMVNSRVSKES